MGDSKLSALTEVTGLVDSDEQYINDGGVSKRITATNLGISLLANAGVTASVAELNFVDGVTSAIQTQLNTNASAIAANTVLANAVSDYNVVINGDFRINQRAYVSAATLAAGVYGHDRWKAGASGGDYSFTQLASSTVVTIAAGKSLIQVIEDKNVAGGTYTVSWTGTAQARGGVDSATPSGAYADSPITLSSQTAGTVMSVEFDDGTLSNIQIDNLSAGTTFTPRQYGEELSLCQRYYEISNCGVYTSGSINGSHYNSQSFLTEKRAVPTLTLSQATLGNATVDTPSVNSYRVSTVGLPVGSRWGYNGLVYASAEL